MATKQRPTDRMGRIIQAGDIIHYYAGSKRDIEQTYVCESLTEGPPHYQEGPNTFRAAGHDGYLMGNRYADRWHDGRYALFELEHWSEVIGTITETPLRERIHCPHCGKQMAETDVSCPVCEWKPADAGQQPGEG